MNQALESVISIEIARLRPNEEFQARYGGLDERHVRLLMRTDPAEWPPLLVVPNDQGGYDLIDGFHRYEAAVRLGLPALPCRVDPEADYPDGVLANISHGLPLTIEDRKIAAIYWAETDPNLSLREIGRRCGLNHETVRRAIESGVGGGGSNQRAQTDPIERLVDQVYRVYSGGHGRSWLGFGREGNPKPFRSAIERYREEDRAVIAHAVDAFGRACVAAAEPYLGSG